MHTITSEQWLSSLRSYKGTPFLHQGRSRRGVDCIGLLVVAGNDLGLYTKADFITGYRRTPNHTLFEQHTSQILKRKPYKRLQAISEQAVPGDALLFWIDKPDLPRHIAVYTGKDKNGQDTFIHSYASHPRKVVETPINAQYWIPRLVGIWSLPNIED